MEMIHWRLKSKEKKQTMSKNKRSNTVFILQAQKATTLRFQKKIR